MKKHDRCPPELLEALKEMHSQAEREFVASAARRAFLSFMRSVLREGERSPRRT